jgi:N4-gp56 family major capsid protein
MSQNITSRTTIPAEVDAVYNRTGLLRVTNDFKYTKWAQVRDIAANAGTTTIKFYRYGNLTAATTPLVEGVTPTGKQLSRTTITGTVQQYGDFVTLTDRLQYETQDPILTETADILGDQMTDTFDQITRDVLVAGTSVFYANGVVGRSSVAANVSATDYKKIERALRKNNAKKITRMITATDGVGTTPIKAAFIALISPDTYFDLQSLSAFKPVESYASTQTLVDENEVGSMGHIRFVETTNAKVFTAAGSGSVDVHADVILAQNAYGITRISGKSTSIITKPLGSAGTADPLEQRATMGWKSYFLAMILNQNFIYRYEHAVSA